MQRRHLRIVILIVPVGEAVRQTQQVVRGAQHGEVAALRDGFQRTSFVVEVDVAGRTGLRRA